MKSKKILGLGFMLFGLIFISTQTVHAQAEFDDIWEEEDELYDLDDAVYDYPTYNPTCSDVDVVHPYIEDDLLGDIIGSQIQVLIHLDDIAYYYLEDYEPNKKYHRKKNRRWRAKILHQAYRIARADGYISRGERRELERMEDELGIYKRRKRRWRDD